jgi:hypothetical protein
VGSRLLKEHLGRDQFAGSPQKVHDVSGWECTFRVSMVYVGWRSIRGLMISPEVRPRREFSLAVAVCGRSGAWLKIRRGYSNVLWLLWEQIGLFCN